VKSMSNLTTKTILAGALAVITLAPSVKASAWDQKTTFTFSEPVAVPGQVLPAGTYVFKLANSNSDRHIVQVFNKDQNHVYGTFLAIPDYRLRPSSKPLIKFDERPAGEPQAVKAWYYPGRSYGHELVYPKKQAVELAQLNNTPVPAMPSELTPDTVKRDVGMKAPEVMALVMAPVVVEEPAGKEVPVETDFPSSPAEPSDELPATASPLPLIEIAGLILLATAIGLRVTASAKAN
jgi:hypothetical protein